MKLIEPPPGRSKKDAEPERELAKNMLIVSLRDLVSNSNTPALKKNRQDAEKWFNQDNDLPFSFGNTISYLFNDEVDSKAVRDRVMMMVEDIDEDE